MTVDVVVPTVGRDSLRLLLAALAGADGPAPGRVLVVDDRRDRSRALAVPGPVEVVPGRAAGPAAARNLGWRRATAEWVAFLDDDVVPPAGWLADLARDLDGLPGGGGGEPGAGAGPDAGWAAGDRLGAERPGAGDGPLGHGGHGLPAGRALPGGGV